MPLTLPTHPTAVIGLKLWRPRSFDGVALVIGAIAPDLAYAADGYGVTIHSHAWHAPLWWALPLTLAGARPVRWAARSVAAHLPPGGPLALRDYGVLATVAHRWRVTASSAVLGAVSHNVWDAGTHATVDGGVILFPLLHHEVRPDLPWWELLSGLSDVTGFVLATVLALHIGRAGLLRRWHGPPPPITPRPAAFWSAVALVLVLGSALLAVQPAPNFPNQAVRGLLVVGAALLAGAVAVRARTAGRAPTSA